MIYILILLDVILNNYSNFNTYFFIIYLYNKKYRYYLITGLILDLIIFKGIYNTIILSIIYIFNYIFKDLNKNNIYNYMLINTTDYLLYILLSNIFVMNNIRIIIFSIGYNSIINILFYYLYFRVYKRGFICKNSKNMII